MRLSYRVEGISPRIEEHIHCRLNLTDFGARKFFSRISSKPVQFPRNIFTKQHVIGRQEDTTLNTVSPMPNDDNSKGSFFIQFLQSKSFRRNLTNFSFDKSNGKLSEKSWIFWSFRHKLCRIKQRGKILDFERFHMKSLSQLPECASSQMGDYESLKGNFRFYLRDAWRRTNVRLDWTREFEAN